jgi:hypothetical protein
MRPLTHVCEQRLGELALAAPGAEPELLVEQQPHLGHRLDVADETGVRSPRSVGRSGDTGAGAGQPDERRAGGEKLPALNPARLTPAVAKPAAGALAPADQSSELPDRDRVLLADQAEQTLVSLRQPHAAAVRPPPPMQAVLAGCRPRAHRPPSE